MNNLLTDDVNNSDECVRCPRLVEHRRKAKSKSPLFGQAWAKPVPPFGDPNAWLLLLGLAPGLGGAGTTGKPFQGDRAGDLLYSALYEAGLSNTEDVRDPGNEVILNGVMITNAALCAPPANKLTSEELDNCRPYLKATLEMETISDIMVMGGVAYGQLCKTLDVRPGIFKHGASYRVGHYVVHCCFHPSGLNQGLGRINKDMIVDLLAGIAERRK